MRPQTADLQLLRLSAGGPPQLNLPFLSSSHPITQRKNDFGSKQGHEGFDRYAASTPSTVASLGAERRSLYIRTPSVDTGVARHPSARLSEGAGSLIGSHRVKNSAGNSQSPPLFLRRASPFLWFTISEGLRVNEDGFGGLAALSTPVSILTVVGRPHKSSVVNRLLALSSEVGFPDDVARQSRPSEPTGTDLAEAWVWGQPVNMGTSVQRHAIVLDVNYPSPQSQAALSMFKHLNAISSVTVVIGSAIDIELTVKLLCASAVDNSPFSTSIAANSLGKGRLCFLVERDTSQCQSSSIAHFLSPTSFLTSIFSQISCKEVSERSTEAELRNVLVDIFQQLATSDKVFPSTAAVLDYLKCNTLRPLLSPRFIPPQLSPKQQQYTATGFFSHRGELTFSPQAAFGGPQLSSAPRAVTAAAVAPADSPHQPLNNAEMASVVRGVFDAKWRRMKGSDGVLTADRLALVASEALREALAAALQQTMPLIVCQTLISRLCHYFSKNVIAALEPLLANEVTGDNNCSSRESGQIEAFVRQRMLPALQESLRQMRAQIRDLENSHAAQLAQQHLQIQELTDLVEFERHEAKVAATKLKAQASHAKEIAAELRRENTHLREKLHQERKISDHNEEFAESRLCRPSRRSQKAEIFTALRQDIRCLSEKVDAVQSNLVSRGGGSPASLQLASSLCTEEMTHLREELANANAQRQQLRQSLHLSQVQLEISQRENQNLSERQEELDRQLLAAQQREAKMTRKLALLMRVWQSGLESSTSAAPTDCLLDSSSLISNKLDPQLEYNPLMRHNS